MHVSCFMDEDELMDFLFGWMGHNSLISPVVIMLGVFN